MNSQENRDLTAQLLCLEQQLMDPVFRRNRHAVASLLAEDFREFGSSGRVWTKEAILDQLAREASFTIPQIEDFAVQRIAADTVLVTYFTMPAEARSASLRSSIWIHQDGAWRMLFHQGTKIPNS